MAKNNKRGRDITGLLVLDKPIGFSSNQALQRVKYLFNAKKVGHTGTLDPLASGVLVLCFGRATKIVDYIMDAPKSYYVIAKLGEQTDTGDREGQVIATRSVTQEHLTAVASTAESFVGDIEQIPPMYSALKKDGVPLYKLAREGKQVERKSRRVHIKSIEINHIDGDQIAMTVHCSKGTYIRTLVEDMGNALGCHAHVAELRRLSVGVFGTQLPMVTTEYLEGYLLDHAYVPENVLLPVEAAFLDYPKRQLKNVHVVILQQGGKLKYPTDVDSEFMRIYDTNGVFCGLGARNSQGNVDFSRFCRT